jgi:hypothetical protein
MSRPGSAASASKRSINSYLSSRGSHLSASRSKWSLKATGGVPAGGQAAQYKLHWLTLSFLRIVSTTEAGKPVTEPAVEQETRFRYEYFNKKYVGHSGKYGCLILIVYEVVALILQLLISGTVNGATPLQDSLDRLLASRIGTIFLLGLLVLASRGYMGAKVDAFLRKNLQNTLTVVTILRDALFLLNMTRFVQ